MSHLRSTIVPVIVRALGMIKKGTDKHINRISGSPSRYEIPKEYFPQRLISLRVYYQRDFRKLTPKRECKKLKYIEYI